MAQDTYNAQVCGNYIMTSHIRNVLVKGENVPVTFKFVLDRTDLPDYCYLMYQRAGDNAPTIVSLEKVVTSSQTELNFEPTLHFCAVAGEVKIQLLVCEIDIDNASDEDMVNLTEIATVNVADALVDPVEPTPIESIFTEYLTQFEQLKEDAEQSASDAEEYAQDAHDALSGLEKRVGDAENAITDLQTPAEIQQYEIDAIFVS